MFKLAEPNFELVQFLERVSFGSWWWVACWVGMVDVLSGRLVPDGLWALVQPLIPEVKVRPQGGASRRARRAGQPGGDRLVSRGSGWCVRAVIRGGLTGPNPVDRGKTGSKIHALADRRGLPLAVGSRPRTPMITKRCGRWSGRSRPVRSRRGPRRRQPAKLHADKAYDVAELRDWLRRRGIVPRIAGKGIDSSEMLGRHRWVIARSTAWLLGYHRLSLRYERHAHIFCAFLTLAAALTCYKKLTK